jgi:hypothetical protein
MKCKCNQEIPTGRANLGYRTCVECSTEQALGCVDIIYHKTGNTIQQCTQEQAEAIRRVSRRSGFGASAGMRAGGDRPMKVQLTRRPMPARARIATQDVLDAIGSEYITLLETSSKIAADKFLTSKVSGFVITQAQARHIETVCTALINSTSIK